MPHRRPDVPLSLLGSLVFGTLLNPLNSSMIAVALVPMQHAFDVGVATSTWLVSGFYLAASVGQPLMGRLVDLFGARRLFVSGLLVVCAASVLAPFAPGFWWLVGLRVLLAAGTSTAFPAAIVLIRAATNAAAAAGNGGSTPREDGEPTPAGALAVITVAASTSAALGPVLGGFLVALAGWQAVFLVNIPITILGTVLALRFLPKSRPDLQPNLAQSPSGGSSREPFLRAVDLPGLALFSGTLTALLIFLLSLADRPQWWLSPVVVVTRDRPRPARAHDRPRRSWTSAASSPTAGCPPSSASRAGSTWCSTACSSACPSGWARSAGSTPTRWVCWCSQSP